MIFERILVYSLYTPCSISSGLLLYDDRVGYGIARWTIDAQNKLHAESSIPGASAKEALLETPRRALHRALLARVRDGAGASLENPPQKTGSKNQGPYYGPPDNWQRSHSTDTHAKEPPIYRNSHMGGQASCSSMVHFRKLQMSRSEKPSGGLRARPS